MRQIASIASATATALLCVAGGASRVAAQGISERHVALLPFYAAPADTGVAATLHARLAAEIGALPGLKTSSPESLRLRLQAASLGQVLRSEAAMGEAILGTGAGYLIGTVLKSDTAGGVELIAAVYSQEEKGVVSVTRRAYPDVAGAEADLPRLARALTRYANLSAADTGFFYSLILPGLGQAMLRRPFHASVAFLLAGGAVWNLARIPPKDGYYVRAGDYINEWDIPSQRWVFRLDGVAVTREAYYEALAASMERSLIALRQRESVERRTRNATVMLMSVWALNLVDTLLLSRHAVDVPSFYEAVGTVSAERGGGIMLHWRIPFAGRVGW